MRRGAKRAAGLHGDSAKGRRDPRGEPRAKRSRASGGTLAASVRRNEWERVALLLLIALTDALQSLPAGDADDLLALLAREAADDNA